LIAFALYRLARRISADRFRLKIKLMSTNPDEQNVSQESTGNDATAGESATSGEDAAKPTSARKILIGSQRDAADPAMGTPKTIRNAMLTPGQVGTAIQGGAEATVSETPAAPAASTTAVSPASPGSAEVPASTSETAVPAVAADAAAVASPEQAAQLAAGVAAGDSTSAISHLAMAQATPSDVANAELEAALDELQMDSLMGDAQQPENELDIESQVKALVTRIHNENVFFSLKGRYEGIASMRQFKTPPEEGKMMDVMIIGFKEEEGLYEVSIPGASVSIGDWSDLVEGAVVEGNVTGSNTGGLEISINNIRGFVPASQIDIVRVENFGDFVNKKMQCVVMEVNEGRRKLVLSRRAILEREQSEKKAELMKTLAVGQTLDGIVTKLMDFGAFVNIGGVEGLVHVSKMSWERVEHPKEVLEPGQKISVKVEKITPDTGKISLSYRDTLENPWKTVDQNYPEGAVVSGTVSRLAQFGAFVKLEPGVEGLVHISELAHHRVMAVKNIVKTGDTVQVKVLSVDPQAQKIGLSLKATQAKPEKESEKKPDATEEPLREAAVRKRDEPLKGGRDRGSGGEQFGLNW